jgi:hypothetical protein
MNDKRRLRKGQIFRPDLLPKIIEIVPTDTEEYAGRLMYIFNTNAKDDLDMINSEITFKKYLNNLADAGEITKVTRLSKTGKIYSKYRRNKHGFR